MKSHPRRMCRLEFYRRCVSIFCLLVIFVLAQACSYVGLTRDTRLAEQLALLSGPVVTPDGSLEGVIVALFRDHSGRLELSKIDRLSASVRGYVFILEASTPYVVVAFQDLDGDLAHDPGEPVGVLGDERRLILKSLDLQEGREIRLERTSPPEGADLVFTTADLDDLESVPIASGDIASLDDPRFDPERGVDGMWQPMASVQDRGLGIYFLEPFDPERLPVLLVHGIGGTPRDFEALVENLDRTQFQPWIFNYPSGIRTQQAANALAGILRSLHNAYKFESLILTAHSMGGLVSKAALLKLVEDGGGDDFVDLFVTFSTPWGGHSAAGNAVRFVPTVVPAWLDMRPGSDFLKTLEAPLPSQIPHHLFFGYDTGHSLVMLYSHDTVVSLDSQLPLWAQEQATRLHGFNLDHMTILGAVASLERYGELLASPPAP